MGPGAAVSGQAASDPALKSIAGRDLERPRDTAGQLALADSWWELAVSTKEPARLALQARAAFWYDKAVGQLTGLNRTKAQKRLDQVADRLNGTTLVSTAPVPVGELMKFEGHTDEIKGVAFAPDGHKIASGGLERDNRDYGVRIWDLATGKLDKVLLGHTKQDLGGRVPSQQPAGLLRELGHDGPAVGHQDRQRGQALHASARRQRPGDWRGTAIRSYREATTRTHACGTRTPPTNSTVTPGRPTSSMRSRSPRTAGTSRPAASIAQVRIFELATGNLVRECDPQTNSIYNVAFTHDSKYVLSSGDNVIHVWDVATGKEVRRFEGHTEPVPAMAISPDGRRLVTGSADRTIRLWDVASGRELHQLKGHTDAVTCVAFSHDGRRVVSGSLDRTVRVWGLPLR